MLRRADMKDLPRLTDLWMEMMRNHHAFEPRMTLSSQAAPSYEKYLQLHVLNSRSIVVVAEEKGTITGFCCAYICQNLPMFLPAEFGFISDLCVQPEHQNKGFGSSLLAHVKEWFARYNIHCIQLQVYSHNASGMGFWRAQGFTSFVERQWLDM